MVPKRTSRVEVLGSAFRFLAIFNVLVVVAALAQIPAASPRHATVAGSTQQQAVRNASDSSLFLPVVTYFAGYMPSAIAIADVNGDGISDLVLADTYESLSGSGVGGVSVLLGNGDGTFGPAATYSSGGNSPRSIAVADLNGDGKPDVLVTDFNGGVFVLLGNGDGTFQAPASYNTGGSEPMGVAVTDVNGDRRPDIVVTNFNSSTVAVLLGNGDGTFQPAVTYGSGGVYASSVVLADVNGDGRPDIVVANECDRLRCSHGIVGVLLGNGDGSFQHAKAYSSGGWDFAGPSSLAVADVNGDGKPDLLVANGCASSSSCPNAAVGVLLGNGDGTFRPVVTYPSGGYTASVAVADVNGDGMPDLVLADEFGADGAGVLLGNGDGSFQSVLLYSSGGGVPYAAAVADLNADGRPDVVIVNCNDWTVGVLINDTASKAPTDTSLLSAINPSVYGQPVTFAAQVTSGSGTPTGTVQILYGSTVVGNGILVNGSVSISVATLPVGSDSMTAAYLGRGGFAPSKSTTLTQTVTVATTTTSLSSLLNPAATGQPVALTATVTSQYGGAATGSITFIAGSQTLGTASLSGKVASITASFSTPGTYVISAKYTGDFNNTGSTSAPLSEKIIASTATSLISSLNPSFPGQAVTFTAAVTSSSGTPPNGEVITFYNGTAVLGTAPLSAGVAAITTSSLPVGIYAITASYPGDTNFAPSTSPGLRQVVNSTTKSATSTTLASSLNPAIYGQTVTFTATVTTTGSLPPTGTVVFQWNDYGVVRTLGTATLNSSGVATLTKSNLNADSYPLTAVYKGDTNNLSSTSPVLNQTVLQTTSAATISSSLNPSAQGQAVTFTMKVTSPTVTPTGPVTFKAGTTVLGTVQLSGGKASYTTRSLPAGSTVVKVTYHGDSNIKGSSAAVTQVVQP